MGYHGISKRGFNVTRSHRSSPCRPSVSAENRAEELCGTWLRHPRRKWWNHFAVATMKYTLRNKIASGSFTSTIRIYPLVKVYPLAIKHGNGKSPMNGGFHGKITYKWFYPRDPNPASDMIKIGG